MSSKRHFNSFLKIPYKNFSRVKLKTDTVELSYNLINSINPECKKHMVFLHGILNSSKVFNALALNESLKRRRNSLLVDVRNHGGSDYHDSMTYREMVEDVIRLMDKLFIEKFTLLGHSIGGKIAMTLATLHPDRLDGLIVLDTIPIDSNETDFSEQSKEIIRKSLEYDICSKKDKRKVFEDFGKIIAETLINNIEYDEGNKGTLKWNCNYKAIHENMKMIMGFEKLGEYRGEVLMMYGENSRKFDIEVYKNIFPNINEDDFKKIIMAGSIINNKGHLVHMERPYQVTTEITKFLDKIDSKDPVEKI